MPIAPVGAAAAASPAAPVAPQQASFSAHLASRAPAPPPSGDQRARPSPALAALEGVERAQRRLDDVLAAARQGRTFSAQELLGLQAEAYRVVQTVDLASKLVEQGAQSVKQALNAQV
ncbi:hypothetical protein [Anaeromyxobacter sp. Fw109-5]|uniref:hypothetical protein n=1 Tax=Anaeromyxobacter sp. (strain Fw109-5) TaxID=404589 RepID=UPI0000ED79E3|nr:hypothetical protein [Anaeromyxobacter sp. Fw109-5]ABS24962.1 conserved hypothetical protein [Anaeromyxobacter sp. Fw109-5]